MIIKFEKDPMTPLYFPFTRLPAGHLKALSGWFSKIALYASTSQAALHDEEAALLKIHVPLPEDEEHFDNLYKSCREWGRVHGQGDLSFFKTVLSEGSSGSSESSAAQIRNAVRQYSRPEQDSSKSKDLLLHARLFLQLARDFDGQAEEISRGMGRVAAMEAKMLRGLMGTMDASKKSSNGLGLSSPADSDPGAHMPAERLAAWSCLLQHDPNEHGLFITVSRAVLDLILEAGPEFVQIATLFSDPQAGPAPDSSWDSRPMVSATILGLAQAPFGSAREQVPVPSSLQEASIYMDLYKISGLKPRSFFQRFLGPYSPAAPSACGPSSIVDTLIGFISIR